MSTITVYLALSLIYNYTFYCTTMVNSGVLVGSITCVQLPDSSFTSSEELPQVGDALTLRWPCLKQNKTGRKLGCDVARCYGRVSYGFQHGGCRW